MALRLGSSLKSAKRATVKSRPFLGPSTSALAISSASSVGAA